MVVQRVKPEVTEAFLDAAERLLIEVGYAGITTRRLAAEAGVNSGLVHYYFGSMEELFLQVLERFTRRLVDRQREMYDAPGPFVEKWRTAMGEYFEADLAAGYPKIRLELDAMAWNRPEMRERLAAVYDEWTDVLVAGFTRAMDELGVDRDAYPVEGVVALVRQFNNGMQLERLLGISRGHRELLDLIERLLAALDGGSER